jgi:P27 family predicted phage terminase small subunit
MGKRGPPKKPTHLKILAGNPGKRALNRREPKPEKGRPVCPHALSRRAKQIWKETCDQLEAMGILAKADRHSIAAYCEAVALHEACCKALVKEGLTFITPQGYVGQRPEIGIRNKAWTTLRQFAKEFGLTPSARANIEVDTPPATSTGSSAPKHDPKPPMDRVEGFLFGRKRTAG